MNFKETEIFGGVLKLFERTVEDVQKLDALIRSMKEITDADNISLYAVILRDSLKHNFDDLKWYQFKRRGLKKKFSDLKYILSHISVKELKDVIVEINELEGILTKKKTDNELAMVS